MSRRFLQFAFEVGEAELHLVDFRFEPLPGLLDITVDGRKVVSKLDTFSRRVERFGFSVGRRERHDVLIEKVRRPVIGGVLPQECRVYVDGRLVGRYTNARGAVRARAGSGRAGVGRTVAGRATPGPLPS